MDNQGETQRGKCGTCSHGRIITHYVCVLLRAIAIVIHIKQAHISFDAVQSTLLPSVEYVLDARVRELETIFLCMCVCAINLLGVMYLFKSLGRAIRASRPKELAIDIQRTLVRPMEAYTLGRRRDGSSGRVLLRTGNYVAARLLMETGSCSTSPKVDCWRTGDFLMVRKCTRMFALAY